MNLQEILDYRTHCLICGKLMKLDFARGNRTQKLSLNITNDGVKIQSGHKDGVYLFFGFDGKYERNSRNYKIYSEPILFYKYCPDHVDESNITSIETMRLSTCYYDFWAFMDAEGNYDVDRHSEIIHYNDRIAFWHINTYFNNMSSLVYHGKLKESLSDITCLDVPAINLSNIKTKEQFLAKIKIYNLFS